MTERAMEAGFSPDWSVVGSPSARHSLAALVEAVGLERLFDGYHPDPAPLRRPTLAFSGC